MAALIALLGYGLARQAPNEAIDSALQEGRAPEAPTFTLPVLQRPRGAGPLRRRMDRALADGRLSLAELRGTPVVLNFWASWCTPCREEAARLERSWRSERRRGVAFVGLNMQDVTADAREFMREFGNTYLNLRDRSDAVARDWGVIGIPETFFVDPRGRIVAHVTGAISGEQLRGGIAAARSGRPLGSLEGGARRGTR